MLPYARWTNALLLPFIAFLDASAWYGMRSVLFSSAMDRGMESSAVGTLFMASSIASVAGMVVGGAVSIAAGPRVILVIGAAVTGLGALGLGLTPVGAMVLFAAIASFGHGMTRPVIYGALAQALPSPRGHLRDAAFVLCYLASNLAAAGVSPMARQVGELASAAIVGSAAVFFFVFLLTIALAVVSFKGRDPEATKPAFRGPHITAVLVLLLTVALPWAMFASGYDLLQGLGSSTFLYLINPIVIVVVAALLAPAFAIAYALGARRFPTPLLIGVGCLAIGASLLGLLLSTGDGDSSEVGAMVSLGVGAVGELLVLPVLLSRISGDLPYRLESAMIAVFLVVSQLPHWLSMPLDDPSILHRPFAWIGVGSGLVVGLALIAAAYPLRRLFDPPSEEDPEPARF